MRRELIRHPVSGGPQVTIAVDVQRRDRRLLLAYALAGRLEQIVLPAAAEPARTDGLWRNSCFEVFLTAGTGYYELNFSPSRAWAAYRFDNYRGTMSEARIAQPAISTSANGGFVLTAEFELPADAAGPLGLSAVIEAQDATLSYWALAHPRGAPDFHHPDCFALELPAPEDA